MLGSIRGRTRPALIGLMLALVAACDTKSQAPEGVVAGEVYIDGAPLKKGLIRFVPTGGASRPADGQVLDGKYEVKAPSGECRVEVTASKVIGKRKMYDTPDSPEVDDVAELVAPRFNAQTILTITVVPGHQEKRFDVQAK